MKNYWITTGAAFGFLGVALGAFGTHQLKTVISPEMMEIYKTGILYHLLHSVVILSIGFYSNPKYFKSALFFSLGIILFSFSLYAYSLTAITAFAMITPLGGVCFLIAWLMVIIVSIKHKL